jgi:transcriptional regulator with XRE-family HTH domain
MTHVRNTTFEEWEAEQLQDPKFRAAVERLEPAYQIARLRISQGLTQKELARLVGTWQPSIARLESGKTEPSLSFLRRVVEALGGRLEVRIVAGEEAAMAEMPAIPTPVESVERDTRTSDPVDVEVELNGERVYTVSWNAHSRSSGVPEPAGAAT